MWGGVEGTIERCTCCCLGFLVSTVVFLNVFNCTTKWFKLFVIAFCFALDFTVALKSSDCWTYSVGSFTQVEV